jgi:hypothetical protein
MLQSHRGLSDCKGSSNFAERDVGSYMGHMRVHSKHRVPTALIIMKGPRATTRHRLPTPRYAKLERAILSADSA